jgi:(1->4)-alpha-D-glucan 1-alpha-D-glucosylmutase
MLERALERARARDEAPTAALEMLGALLLQGADGDEEHDRDERLHFIQRFQQTSGPATAKGVEDTALYRYVPLASLNEVGGDPGRNLAGAVGELHRANEERQAQWPRSLLCTSTHDTKRSADVRSRLDVLSEMPDEWLRLVRRWRQMLARHRARARGGAAPDGATEWLIFQSLLGIWPAEAPPQRAARDLRDRIVEYMRKANREAKVRTSWTSPDERYEYAIESYIDAALGNQAFVADMAACAARVAPAGYCNALSRLIVHLTAPGTPDIYQGDEMWNFTLVDPDNRRPVDFAARRSALDRIDTALQGGDVAVACAEMLGNAGDGRIKMHVTRCALDLRRRMSVPFLRGEYKALEARGEKQHHALAFTRTLEGSTILTAVTRLPLSMTETETIPTGLAWGDSAIIFSGSDVPHRWRCALTGVTVEAQKIDGGAALLAREVYSRLPVALLIAA